MDRGLQPVSRAARARDERPWTDWPDALQRRDPAAIDRARRELADEVLFFQYLQWIAGMQWRRARLADPRRRSCSATCRSWSTATAPTSGCVSISSASIVSVGAPPDAFSADRSGLGHAALRLGARSRAEDFRWLRERARRSADLFDGYRVDHLVGFYRTYGHVRCRRRRVLHAGRRAVAGGARRDACFGLFRAAGAEIIAEDLGTVPDFVRASLARLGIPGLPRVPLGAALARPRTIPFRDPSDYPRAVGRGVRYARHRADRDRGGKRRRKRRAERRRRRLPTVWRVAGRRRHHARRRSTRGVRDALLEVAVRVGVRAGAAAGAGRLRLARSHQRAGARSRPTTGRSACRGRSIALDQSPGRSRAQGDACAAGPSATDGGKRRARWTRREEAFLRVSRVLR